MAHGAMAPGGAGSVPLPRSIDGQGGVGRAFANAGLHEVRFKENGRLTQPLAIMIAAAEGGDRLKVPELRFRFARTTGIASQGGVR
jgi:hypothetical protein